MIAGCGLLVGLLGCASESDTSANVYDARGIVRQLPSAERPGTELFIHHEAIPSFASIDGEITGMESMTMGFPVIEPQLLDDVKVGDRISFSLQVDWDGSPPLAITRLEQLPEGTRLAFETPATADEPARPPEDDADSHAGHHGHGANPTPPEPSTPATPAAPDGTADGDD